MPPGSPRRPERPGKPTPDEEASQRPLIPPECPREDGPLQATTAAHSAWMGPARWTLEHTSPGGEAIDQLARPGHFVSGPHARSRAMVLHGSLDDAQR